MKFNTLEKIRDAQWYWYLSILLALYFFFIRIPFKPLLYFMVVAMPIIGAAYTFIFKKTEGLKEQLYELFICFMIIPVVAVYCSLYYEINSVHNPLSLYAVFMNGWFPFIMIVIAIALSFLKKHRGKTWYKTTSLCAFLILYIYFSILDLNAVLDSSTPQEIEVSVSDTERHKPFYRKHNATAFERPDKYYYFVHITPWLPQQEEEKFKVNHEQYKGFKKGQKIKLKVKKGFFGLQWFYYKDPFIQAKETDSTSHKHKN